MSKVSDVIGIGETIPDDVTRVADKDEHVWEWQPGARWFCVTTHFGTTSIEAEVLSREWAPLRVTAVREPEPERTLIGPPHAHLDAACTDKCYEAASAQPEPQQADASALLDLVRQYGHACHENGRLKGKPGETEAFADVQTLFDRIAALVPQQPKADPDRDALSRLLKTQATNFLAATNKLVAERDEARTQVDRLGAEVFIERQAEGRANAELREIVKRLDEAEVDSGGASERVGYAIQSMQRGWSTAKELQARLDTVKSDRETVRASLAHLKDTVTRPAIKALGVQHNEDIVPAIERFTAAQSDPSVLSLPQVPPGTVALVVQFKGQEIRFEPYAEGGWIRTDWEGESWDLPALLEEFGPARVVMREPRTWPRLDTISNDLKAVQGASGKVYHRSHFSQSVPVFRERGNDGDPLTGPGHMFYALQTFDGPLTEVFEDEPGGEPR